MSASVRAPSLSSAYPGNMSQSKHIDIPSFPAKLAKNSLKPFSTTNPTDQTTKWHQDTDSNVM